MIKNLIFDFGKVLVDYEYFETLDQIFKTHEQAEEFYHLLIDGKWNENMTSVRDNELYLNAL